MATRLKTKTYRSTARNLAFLAQRLRDGEIVAVPTETVYGLAGNALDPAACAKIFHAKGRPTNDPLIVHIHSLEQLALIATAGSKALKLAHRFWPGPLTLVLRKTRLVPGIVTARRASVAVRMPSHPVFRRLLKLAGVPLAAPSANPFGYISPTTAQHVQDGLGGKIFCILDGGPAKIGIESTILDLRHPSRPVLLRQGAITQPEIERVIGRIRLRRGGRRAQPGLSAQVAPGLMARHYSPTTPVVLHDSIELKETRCCATDAWIFLRRPRGLVRPNTYWLDPKGNLIGAARRLFATLRKADAQKCARIHVELAPDRGIGRAINDRLRRAAAR